MHNTLPLGTEVHPIVKSHEGIWVPIPVVMLAMRRTTEHMDTTNETRVEYRFSDHTLDKKVASLPAWFGEENLFRSADLAAAECELRNTKDEDEDDNTATSSEANEETTTAPSTPPAPVGQPDTGDAAATVSV